MMAVIASVVLVLTLVTGCGSNTANKTNNAKNIGPVRQIEYRVDNAVRGAATVGRKSVQKVRRELRGVRAKSNASGAANNVSGAVTNNGSDVTGSVSNNGADVTGNVSNNGANVTNKVSNNGTNVTHKVKVKKRVVKKKKVSSAQKVTAPKQQTIIEETNRDMDQTLNNVKGFFTGNSKRLYRDRVSNHRISKSGMQAEQGTVVRNVAGSDMGSGGKSVDGVESGTTSIRNSAQNVNVIDNIWSGKSIRGNAVGTRGITTNTGKYMTAVWGNQTARSGNFSWIRDMRFANDQLNQGNRVDNRRLLNNNLIGPHKNYHIEMSTRAADDIAALAGVNQAYVLVSDYNAYVALDTSEKQRQYNQVRAQSIMNNPIARSTPYEVYVGNVYHHFGYGLLNGTYGAYGTGNGNGTYGAYNTGRGNGHANNVLDAAQYDKNFDQTYNNEYGYSYTSNGQRLYGGRHQRGWNKVETYGGNGYHRFGAARIDASDGVDVNGNSETDAWGPRYREPEDSSILNIRTLDGAREIRSSHNNTVKAKDAQIKRQIKASNRKASGKIDRTNVQAQISEVIQNRIPNVYHVYVSDNNRFVAEMASLDQQWRSGDEIQGNVQNFNRTVDQLFATQ
jgi:hypothetical protein